MNIKEARELEELRAENLELATENARLRFQVELHKYMLESELAAEDKASQEPLV